MNQILQDRPQPAATGRSKAPAAVEFRAVSKRYGPVKAVQDVSFSITRGTLVTLLGPSGCGKTSTLRLVAGLEHPSEGRILIDGQDVTHLSAAERDVSMVFQSYALFPHMTVMENVCYGLRASGIRRAEAEAMAAEKLATVGLAGFEKRLPSELSGGQQQRVAVARAIVLEPKVLLFDEPLSNLDAKLRRRVRADIRELQRKLDLTVVYVTHDQEEALAVSDRIIVMRSGVIVQDGTPRDLYERPSNRFIADFIGNANLLPVTIRRTDAVMAEVRVGSASLRLPHRDVADGPAELAVRPQCLSLRARPPGQGELPGRIRKAAYLGDHMEYEVVLDELGTELLVEDPAMAKPLQEGAAVAVALDPAGAVVVPA
ncbi:ATP-binding cassette domain-containing protein [Pseudoroseomonas wenyumeiae]|uniref:ABC transporter ATP-binding protein n=1 Tax=Teichococcus wenyumeiae TaxID=2478470 RepID=A0A3A9JNB8_9PROT|nr:ABC transporter ATP-binding protein [Pseudoroseomonas wenyumeiae]RKK06005.1 ABC transporter ATP-binding protein [Pseudoroseomonas wenyumeiae]RMI19522.1 ATP-binding cassette domain-containing protein [Pseudoroseomonas wenyumeiae]